MRAVPCQQPRVHNNDDDDEGDAPFAPPRSYVGAANGVPPQVRGFPWLHERASWRANQQADGLAAALACALCSLACCHMRAAQPTSPTLQVRALTEMLESYEREIQVGVCRDAWCTGLHAVCCMVVIGAHVG